jgi:hypothetical protein
LDYTIVLDNNGPSVSRVVELSIQPPEGTDYSALRQKQPEPHPGSRVCSLNEYPDGTEIEVSLDMLVDSEVSGTLTLQASLSADTADPDGTNNSASEDTTVIVPDTVPPTVAWVTPVGNEQSFDVSGEIISLEVDAIDNVSIQRVDFFWWDPVVGQFIDIGPVYASPYRIDFDTSVLYAGYNQVYVRAYDSSGNASNRPRILLYRLVQVNWLYLPLIRR